MASNRGGACIAAAKVGIAAIKAFRLKYDRYRFMVCHRTIRHNAAFIPYKMLIMKNNDILRRLRYTFDFSDDKVIRLFGLGGLEVTREQISNWLKKDDDPQYVALNDKPMACFLNGLIIEKRGAREDGPPKPEQRLNNNMVLVKLKIALNFKAEDVLDMLALAGFKLGKHELSAFFRKAGHKQYRECLDQVLRNFLQGMQIKFRDKTHEKAFDWGDYSA